MSFRRRRFSIYDKYPPALLIERDVELLSGFRAVEYSVEGEHSDNVLFPYIRDVFRSESEDERRTVDRFYERVVYIKRRASEPVAP